MAPERELPGVPEELQRLAEREMRNKRLLVWLWATVLSVAVMIYGIWMLGLAYGERYDGAYWDVLPLQIGVFVTLVGTVFMALRLNDGVPDDLREPWTRANKQYAMGRAGEDAAQRGAVAAEIQHPQQALRDVTRATAPMQDVDKILPAGVQWVVDRLARLFGRDVFARHQMDAALRQARGQPGRRAAALTYTAPGVTAEAVRRALEEQRQRAQENVP